MIQQSRKLLVRYISSAIIGDILDDSDAAEYANNSDPAVQKAIKILSEGNAFPRLGEKQRIDFNHWQGSEIIGCK